MSKMLVAAASMVAAALMVVTGASAQPSSSSLHLVVLGVGTSSGQLAAQPRVGSQVTFTLDTTAQEPWVSVACYQNGIAVYGQYWGFWNGYSPSTVTSTMAAGGVFTLGPTFLWSGGQASCVATLYTVSAKNWKQTTLATTSFTAGA
jgi:hypothetical protein